MDNTWYNNKIVNPFPALFYALFLSICPPYLDVVLPPKSALHLRLSPFPRVITCGDFHSRKFPFSELVTSTMSNRATHKFLPCCHICCGFSNSLVLIISLFFAGGKQGYMVLTIFNLLRSLNAGILILVCILAAIRNWELKFTH